MTLYSPLVRPSAAERSVVEFLCKYVCKVKKTASKNGVFGLKRIGKKSKVKNFKFYINQNVLSFKVVQCPKNKILKLFLFIYKNVLSFKVVQCPKNKILKLFLFIYTFMNH